MIAFRYHSDFKLLPFVSTRRRPSNSVGDALRPQRFQNATQSGVVKPCRRHREAARNPAGVSGVDSVAPCGISRVLVACCSCRCPAGSRLSALSPQPLLPRIAPFFDVPKARRCARAPQGRRWRTHTGRALTRLRYSFSWWGFERV